MGALDNLRELAIAVGCLSIEEGCSRDPIQTTSNMDTEGREG